MSLQRAKSCAFPPSAVKEEHRAEEWDCSGSCLHHHRSCEGKTRDLFPSGDLVLTMHYRAGALLFQAEGLELVSHIVGIAEST